MSARAAIKAVLEGDGTLLTTATGGVWDFDETGRLGINRTTTPTAFDASGIIKPCLLLKLRSAIPDGVLMDQPSQYASVRETYEIWFYQDDGFDDIDTMLDRVYTLLHSVQVSGTFRVDWIGDFVQFRDDVIDANMNRSDYMATVSRST